MTHPTDSIFRRAMAPLLAGVAAALLLPLPAPAEAPPLPEIPPGESMGVNIHFVEPKPGEMEMIAAAGFKWVRQDIYWSSIEQQKGRYNFYDYDHLLAALDKQKMHALLILDYGNALYAEPGEPPPLTRLAGTDAYRAAFSKWAAATVSHFAGRGCIWEMWNEPNTPYCWGPEPNPDQYVALAKAAAAAIHKVAPNEPIIGPGTSMVDLKFVEACCKGGLLEDWSGISVHPYRQTEPERAADEFHRLHSLIAKYAPEGRKIPIISSEWGYSTAWKGMDEQKQARYLKREFMVNLANGIPLSIWYDWHDDFASEDSEHRFGIVHFDYHPGRNPVYDPKPAYQAAKETAEQLAGESAGGGSGL